MRKGFSLLELLIVMGIMAVLIGGASLYLGQTNAGLRLDNTTSELVTMLRSAQQKSASQEDGARWGIYIDNADPTDAAFTLFSVDEVLAADTNFTGIPGTVDQRVALSSAVGFSTPSDGGTMRIYFEKGTGLPTTPETIVLMSGTLTKTITVEANGRITY